MFIFIVCTILLEKITGGGPLAIILFFQKKRTYKHTKEKKRQKSCPRRPRPISSSQSPDLLSSSFVNFLSFLLHSLNLSNLQFSNRCKFGISLKCRWKIFCHRESQSFLPFLQTPAFPTFSPLLYQTTSKFSNCQTPSLSLSKSQRAFVFQIAL